MILQQGADVNRRPDLAGDLEFVSLADIFQLLGGGNYTGILRLSSDFSKIHGEIHFVSGEPVDARWGAWFGMDALHPFFGWQEGRFEFRPQEFSGRRTIRKGRMEIVLDALRMLDDGLIKKVGVPHRLIPYRSGGLSDSYGTDLAVIRGPLIDYSLILAEESFEDRRRIVSEGSYGNWIWVILEGRAIVSREKEGEEIPIFCLGEGSFIGGLEVLVFGDHVRAATVTAVGEVKAALLDTHRLSTELMSLSSDFRKSLLNMSTEVKKVTDDLLLLLTKCGNQPQAKPVRIGSRDLFSCDYESESSLGSIVRIGCEKGRFQVDSFPSEIGLLSKTFKGFVQCTADIILSTTRRAWTIRNRTADPGRSQPNRKTA